MSLTSPKAQSPSSKRISWKPHRYQKRAVKFLLEHYKAALFLDPGLGKTSIVLEAVSELKRRGELQGPVLVVAPKRVIYDVWPREIEKWEQFKGLTYAILHGDKKEQALKQGADIHLINPEGLKWLFGVRNIESQFTGKKKLVVDIGRVKQFGYQLLVVDESSKFKNASSGRHRSIRPLLNYVQRVWILTGSPAPNGYMDLFGQIYLLDEGSALGTYITHFRNEFFTASGYGGYTFKLKPGADRQIQERIKPYALRLAAEDYLELPQRIPVPVYIDLPPDIMEMYRNMEDEMLAHIDGERYTAAGAAVASIKCRQIVQGGLYRDWREQYMGHESWTPLHDAKTEALEDLVDELGGQQLLIAFEFGHDLTRLRKQFGNDLPVINGNTPAKVASRYISQWNAGELPLLALHPASTGHGLNLQEGNANHIAFYAQTWDYDAYDQLIRRLQRQGNKAKSIFVYNILARNTVDEVMVLRTKQKGIVQDRFLTALNTYRSSRK